MNSIYSSFYYIYIYSCLTSGISPLSSFDCFLNCFLIQIDTVYILLLDILYSYTFCTLIHSILYCIVLLQALLSSVYMHSYYSFIYPSIYPILTSHSFPTFVMFFFRLLLKLFLLRYILYRHDICTLCYVSYTILYNASTFLTSVSLHSLSIYSSIYPTYTL